MLTIRKSLTLDTQALSLTFTRQESVQSYNSENHQSLQIRVAGAAPNSQVAVMDLNVRQARNLLLSLKEMVNEMEPEEEYEEEDDE